MLCGLILLLDAGAEARHPPSYVVYGLKIFTTETLQSVRDHLIGEFWGHGEESWEGKVHLPLCFASVMGKAGALGHCCAGLGVSSRLVSIERSELNVAEEVGERGRGRERE